MVQRSLLRVFPNGSRVDSSNFSPLEFWNAGVPMGKFSRKYFIFSQNGFFFGCVCMCLRYTIYQSSGSLRPGSDNFGYSWRAGRENSELYMIPLPDLTSLCVCVLSICRCYSCTELPNSRADDGFIRRQVPPERRMRIRSKACDDAPAWIQRSVKSQRKCAHFTASALANPGTSKSFLYQRKKKKKETLVHTYISVIHHV